MPDLVADCPRCGSSKITFEVLSSHTTGVRYDWQRWYEAFSICRHCQHASIFVLADSANADYNFVHKKGLLNLEQALNRFVTVEGFVSLKDRAGAEPPEHLPGDIEAVFREAATCLAVGCNNAAGTMFRLCLDLATRAMLPVDAPGLNASVRRNLGLRLPWLFNNGKLPEALRELSGCVKDDGNDGAHSGTLTVREAEDLLDFTRVLLERLYTEPARIQLAKERRDERRSKASGSGA